jgi:hypothetical protein
MTLDGFIEFARWFSIFMMLVAILIAIRTVKVMLQTIIIIFRSIESKISYEYMVGYNNVRFERPPEPKPPEPKTPFAPLSLEKVLEKRPPEKPIKKPLKRSLEGELRRMAGIRKAAEARRAKKKAEINAPAFVEEFLNKTKKE